MNPNDEQINMASELDVKFWELQRMEHSKMQILAGMSEHMSKFKTLMDELGEDGINQLSLRFNGFYRYGKLLEDIATGIASGKIRVP